MEVGIFVGVVLVLWVIVRLRSTESTIDYAKRQQAAMYCAPEL